MKNKANLFGGQIMIKALSGFSCHRSKNIHLRLKIGGQWVKWLTAVKIFAFASVQFVDKLYVIGGHDEKHRNRSRWDEGLHFTQEKIIVLQKR